MGLTAGRELLRRLPPCRPLGGETLGRRGDRSHPRLTPGDDRVEVFVPELLVLASVFLAGAFPATRFLGSRLLPGLVLAERTLVHLRCPQLVLKTDGPKLPSGGPFVVCGHRLPTRCWRVKRRRWEDLAHG